MAEIDEWLSARMAEELAEAQYDEKVRGDMTGEPLGILAALDIDEP